MLENLKRRIVNKIVMWQIRRALAKIRNCRHEWRPSRILRDREVCPKCRAYRNV
jgi:hypothetical protein